MNSFFLAVQFLTRLPIPASLVRYNEEDLQRSLIFYPLAGLLLGLLLTAIDFLAAKIFSQNISSFLVLSGYFILTGGLHLDGLMDTADGLLSNKSKDEMLQIMRDSRIGAMGTLAGVMIIIGKWLALTEINTDRFFYILLIPSASRCLVVLAMKFWTNPRSDGRISQKLSQEIPLLFVVIILIYTMLLLFIFLKIPGLLLLLSGAALMLIMGSRISGKIGGLTGDNYGAIIEVVELGLLLFAAAAIIK